MDLPAGSIQEEVTPSVPAPNQRFTLHLLAVYGPRTLRAFGGRTFTETGPAPVAQTPVVGECGFEPEELPVMPDVQTFTLEMHPHTQNPLSSGWQIGMRVPGQGDFPCGGLGTGSQVRFTDAITSMRTFGAFFPTGDNAVSYRDTYFDFDIHYTYSAPTAEGAI
jgi:hypothetical protein